MRLSDARTQFLSNTNASTPSSNTIRKFDEKLQSFNKLSENNGAGPSGQVRYKTTQVIAKNVQPTSNTHTRIAPSSGSKQKKLSRTDSSPLALPGWQSQGLKSSNEHRTLFSTFENTNYEKISSPPLPTKRPQSIISLSKNSDYYMMNHKYRGRAVIFSHANFSDGLESRVGSEKDVDNLMKYLPRLGYLKQHISVHHDLTYSDINKTLVALSKEDHSDSDSLLVIVLTHGEFNDKIYAQDTEYSVEKLWKNFLGDYCPSLHGKPKIFFIIACRGRNTDAGVKITSRRRKLSTSTDAAEIISRQSYTIPIQADVLTVYSTTPGFFSYREETRGTWYIEAFCKELAKLTPKENIDFVDFLTKVNLNVSSYNTYNPEEIVLDNKKQCSSFTSTLLRKITMEIN